MSNRLKKLAVMVLSAALIMSGCGGKKGNDTEKGTGSGSGDELRIVTSFFPVYVAVINVTRDISGVSVTNMTEPQTGCLHDYSLKPDDLKLLESADIFIINGAGMEAFLDDVIRQQENLRIIEAAGDIEVLRDESGEVNPHVWVSVSNAITYVKNIADKLSEIDGKNADRYQSNAGSYIARLEALKNEMHGELDGLKNRDIITFHEAFPYFAQEFDLNIAAVVEREPGTEPTQKELAAIIDLVRETGIRALFAEPQYSPKVAEAIAADTGAVVYTLDPVVTGEAVPEAADAYLEAMRRNMETLKEALG